MTTKMTGLPKGYHTITPSIMVKGAPEAIDFYKKALGAEEVMRFAGPDGRIMHAELRFGDSPLMLGEEMAEYGAKAPTTYGGTPVSFFIYTDDVESAWKRAIDAGAKEVMPLADQFWGDRAGCCEDPFGHSWWLAQRLRDMTIDELKQAADSFFSQPHG